MNVRKSFLLRISPALYEAGEWAKQERQVNGQVEYLLQEAVRKRDHKFTEDKEATQEEDLPGPKSA